MRTLRQRLKQILTLLVVLTVYNPVFGETKDTDPHQGHDSLDWPGIYFGSLPCADCVAIKTSLALNKNGSYVLITQYLGKSEREFVEKGKFSWGEKNNTIVLTPRNGSSAQQYLVAENQLIQLDNNGNRFSGKQADRYILRRTDVTQPGSASSHSH